MIGTEDWIKVSKAVVRPAHGGAVYEFTDCETTSDDITTTFHTLDKNGEDIYSVMINANIESIVMYGVSVDEPDQPTVDSETLTTVDGETLNIGEVENVVAEEVPDENQET